MGSAAQSALQPAAGSGADLIAQLGSVLYLGAAALLTLVAVLALLGVSMRARTIDPRRWILGGGLVLPIVTLSALLVYSLVLGNALSTVGATNLWQVFLDCFDAEADPAARLPPGRVLRVHVVGKQWWWEVRYEQPGRAAHVVSANELHIPIDRPVELILSTTDVIHSFWVPALAGKVDMIPGRTTRLRLTTSEVGRFRGQCAEYCGTQHALMAFFVVTHTPEDFVRWLEREAMPQSRPSDPWLAHGYESFFKGSCHGCHAVRGTSAAATTGPDLTHVGGRSSLAAGTLRNHAGTMAGWIAGTQEIKRGAAMPANSGLTGEELRALAEWLVSLK